MSKSPMKLFTSHGIFIGYSTSEGEKVLKENGYKVMKLQGNIMFAQASQKPRSYQSREIILVRKKNRTTFGNRKSLTPEFRRLSHRESLRVSLNL